MAEPPPNPGAALRPGERALIVKTFLTILSLTTIHFFRKVLFLSYFSESEDVFFLVGSIRLYAIKEQLELHTVDTSFGIFLPLSHLLPFVAFPLLGRAKIRTVHAT